MLSMLLQSRPLPVTTLAHAPLLTPQSPKLASARWSHCLVYTEEIKESEEASTSVQYRVRRIICGACPEKSKEQHEAGSDSTEALVDEYIEWFAARDENQDAADWEEFGSACIQLKTERYDLEGIRKWTILDDSIWVYLKD